VRARSSRWLHVGAALRDRRALPVLVLFFSLPFLVVLKISVSDVDGVHFKDLVTWVDGALTVRLKFTNYLFLTSDPEYILTYLESIGVRDAEHSDLPGDRLSVRLLHGTLAGRLAAGAAMLVSLPSGPLPVCACRLERVLDDDGVVNNLLLWAALIDSPSKMMHTAFSMMVGMVYTYLPFMILRCSQPGENGRCACGGAARTGFDAVAHIRAGDNSLSWSGIIAGSVLCHPQRREYVIRSCWAGPRR